MMDAVSISLSKRRGWGSGAAGIDYTKSHEMGLGRFPDVSLREARETADDARLIRIKTY